MPKVTIVAIPSEEDYVWRLSSEKVPHLTLLFLGDVSDTDVDKIVEFVQHACRTSAHVFGLSVDHRGSLGPDNADVLFFEKTNWNIGDISRLRDYILANDTVQKAYHSTEQYPEWTPHLTMGYPTSPAKKDDRDYPGTSYVRFDRIAVWTGDFEGPTFRLDSNDVLVEEVAMSGVEKMLAHYGIKGMRWGVRRNVGSDGRVDVTTTAQPGKKVVAKGGQGQPAHEDAIRTAVSKQKAKASTTDSLSTKELQELVNRMNLEQQYSKLSQEKGFFDKIDQDKKKVDKLLGAGQTANNVYTFVNSPVGKGLKEALKKKVGG